MGTIFQNYPQKQKHLKGQGMEYGIPGKDCFGEGLEKGQILKRGKRSVKNTTLT